MDKSRTNIGTHDFEYRGLNVRICDTLDVSIAYYKRKENDQQPQKESMISRSRWKTYLSYPKFVMAYFYNNSIAKKENTRKLATRKIKRENGR